LDCGGERKRDTAFNSVKDGGGGAIKAPSPFRFAGALQTHLASQTNHSYNWPSADAIQMEPHFG
jgi:hypothetical protein